MFDREEYINSPTEINFELYALFNKRKKLIIFDIGACEGLDSIRYSRLFPSAKIFSFEPLPENLIRIDGYTKCYPQITAIPIALSDKVGKSTLYVSSGHPETIPNTPNWDFGNKSSSLLTPNFEVLNKHHNWLNFRETILVETNTLDNFCKEKGIYKIDFIHMDVQGAELMVLKGGSNMLNRTVAIWLEVSTVQSYLNQPLAVDVHNFLARHGFKLVKNTCASIFGDGLYVRSPHHVKIGLARIKMKTKLLLGV